MHNSFRTEVPIAASQFSIDHQQRVLLLGSCFATNVGGLLVDHKFRCLVNPFGVLYNPLSIAECLHLLVNNQTITNDNLVEHDGLWHSWLHHGSFSHTTAEATLNAIEFSKSQSIEWLQQTSVLIVTFGTARVYRLKQTGMVVANCHKFPARDFSNEMLAVEDIVQVWQQLIETLRHRNPQLRILFTVSPIRHWKDGAHDNVLSKSTLLLAIDKLQKQFAQTEYFPAYELLMDDLRDYRFYESDMLHPNKVAIDYVWQRFGEMFFSGNTTRLLKPIADIRAACAHRPLHPQSEQYRTFIQSTLQKIAQLEQQHPYLDFTAEKQQLATNLP